MSNTPFPIFRRVSLYLELISDKRGDRTSIIATTAALRVDVDVDDYGYVDAVAGINVRIYTYLLKIELDFMDDITIHTSSLKIKMDFENMYHIKPLTCSPIS